MSAMVVAATARIELGQAAQHRQHQPPVRAGGVRPGVLQRTEAGSPLRDGIDDVEQVAGRARQPVDIVDALGLAGQLLDKWAPGGVPKLEPDSFRPPPIDYVALYPKPVEPLLSLKVL